MKKQSRWTERRLNDTGLHCKGDVYEKQKITLIKLVICMDPLKDELTRLSQYLSRVYAVRVVM